MKRVRAIIIKDKKVLTIKRTKPNTTYWVIPGGGVEDGESDEQALIRECKEELGVTIDIKNIFLKIDSKKPETIGQKEYFYLCDIIDGTIGSGDGPEFQKNTKYIGVYDIEWLDIKNLHEINLKPDNIRDLIKKLKF